MNEIKRDDQNVPRRWSGRSGACETCNLHGASLVQVACRLRLSTYLHSESLRYFKVVSGTQTSTHSDGQQPPHLCEGPPPPRHRQPGPGAPEAISADLESAGASREAHAARSR